VVEIDCSGPDITVSPVKEKVGTGTLKPVFRIRIRIGSGFNQVLGSGSGFGIRIRIQGQESDEEIFLNIF